MFSLGYKKNNGILKYTDFENISARMNSSYNVNKYITVGENFTVTYTSQVDCAPMENALKMALLYRCMKKTELHFLVRSEV